MSGGVSDFAPAGVTEQMRSQGNDPATPRSFPLQPTSLVMSASVGNFEHFPHHSGTLDPSISSAPTSPNDNNMSTLNFANAMHFMASPLSKPAPSRTKVHRRAVSDMTALRDVDLCQLVKEDPSVHGSCELLEPSEAQHLVLNLHSALGEPCGSGTMKAEDIHIKSVDPMNIDEVEDLDEDVSELLRSKAGGMSRKTGSGHSGLSLQELSAMDPKRVKRILANRQSAARSKERKLRYMYELESKTLKLQSELNSLKNEYKTLQNDMEKSTAESTDLQREMQSMEESHRLRESAEAALKLEIQQIQNGSVPTLTLTPSTVSSPVATPTSAVQNVHSLAPLAHTPMAAAVPAAVSPTATSPAAQRTLLFPPAAPGSPAAALQQALLAEATSQLLLQQQHQQVQHSPSVPSPSQLPPLKLPAGVTIQLPDGSKLELPAGSTLSGTPSQPPAPQLQFPQFFRVSQAGTLEPVPQQQPQEQQQQQAQAPNPPQPQLQVPIQMPSNPYRDAAASAFQYAASALAAARQAAAMQAQAQALTQSQAQAHSQGHLPAHTHAQALANAHVHAQAFAQAQAIVQSQAQAHAQAQQAHMSGATFHKINSGQMTVASPTKPMQTLTLADVIAGRLPSVPEKVELAGGMPRTVPQAMPPAPTAAQHQASAEDMQASWEKGSAHKLATIGEMQSGGLHFVVGSQGHPRSGTLNTLPSQRKYAHSVSMPTKSSSSSGLLRMESSESAEIDSWFQGIQALQRTPAANPTASEGAS